MKRKQSDPSAAKQNHKRYRSTRQQPQDPTREIQPGDSGIWVTCELGKEARCVTELRALFEEHFDRLSKDTVGDAESSVNDAIEDAIDKELDGLRDNESKPFRSVKLNDQCLLFFKTSPAQVNPADFVLSFCQDIASNRSRKRAYAVKRLTPMALVGRATEADIDELAATVLAPHFHINGSKEQKFAIRVNIRNNQVIKRDNLIRQVAAKVGEGHKVDLGNPDLFILVEVYKNLCGMSVVNNEYEKLKRYNLAEIRPSAPAQSETAKSTSVESPKMAKST